MTVGPAVPASCGIGRYGWWPRVRPNYESQWAAIGAVAQKLGLGSAETVPKCVRQAEVDGGQRRASRGLPSKSPQGDSSSSDRAGRRSVVRALLRTPMRGRAGCVDASLPALGCQRRGQALLGSGSRRR
jgi:transposase-like protein